MATQTVERFACPNCGGNIFIEWDRGETARLVPCNSCYGESYVDEFGPLEVDGVPQVKMRFDESTGQRVAIPLTVRTRHDQVTNGFKGRCTKGTGVEVVDREVKP
jgi:hypothetical protein